MFFCQVLNKDKKFFQNIQNMTKIKESVKCTKKQLSKLHNLNLGDKICNP